MHVRDRRRYEMVGKVEPELRAMQSGLFDVIDPSHLVALCATDLPCTPKLSALISSVCWLAGLRTTCDCC